MRTGKFEPTAEEIINGTKHWNGGAGLIVSPYIAKLLRERGIKEGYTVSKMMSLVPSRKKE